MSLNHVFILLFIGICAGFLSGMVGIGGGIVIVPMLVYFLGFEQHTAQGTTLFMFLFPIGILGVMNYYNKGNVDMKTAAVICTTFILGSYFGSKIALSIDKSTITKVFGVIFLLISLKMIFGK
ncbi:MAG TPA: sulfite exporter TauE/SafE family protein [Bacteroidia bacterium]|nr:sulfite exporter TauE/SafE family protein [Bacteroidia bacterium]